MLAVLLISFQFWTFGLAGFSHAVYIKNGKQSFYIVHYPVVRTAQSTLRDVFFNKILVHCCYMYHNILDDAFKYKSSIPSIYV